MPKFRAVLLAVLAAAPLLVACGGGDGPVRVRWFVGQEVSGAYREIAARCTAAAGGAYEVTLEQLPRNSDDQREQLVRRLAAGDRGVDLIGMDVIWTAEFAGAGWLLPFDDNRAEAVSRGVLAGPLATATYQGRLWAAPFTSNTQLLWYRKSRVNQVPTTWDQLIGTAELIPDGTNTVAVQGGRYEGYTTWVSALLASAGTELVAEADRPDRARAGLAPGPAELALGIVRRLARSPVAERNLAVAVEADTRESMLSGRAAFSVNYPPLYAAARAEAPELVADLGWAPYPRVVAGLPARPPLGGVNLGVSRFSRHPTEAFAAAGCLRSAANQQLAAVQGGLPPSLDRVYDVPAVRRQFPFAVLLRDSIAAAAPRPATPAWADVSLAVQQVLHPPASVDPATAVPALRSRIEDALDSQALL